ncbi:MAG: 4'-phosphopantetheinyl transferase superfamily protein [Gammaproteobacteria bacterium]|nr:4'-phosphopantetheinyl transferase superfamily protein [Gammaproteobacteria bacterium]
MDQLGYYQSFLSPEEWSWVQPTSSAAVRILARGLLRRLLAHYLKTDPHTLCFEYGIHGKPRLKGGGLQFNVSHSHEKIVMIFSKDHAVGVDVEYVKRKAAYLAIAKRFFSQKEAAYLSALSSAALPGAFFKIWTLKEAYVKSTGEGVGAFRYFSVDIEDKDLRIQASSVLSSPCFLSQFVLDKDYQVAYTCQTAERVQVCAFNKF